MVFGPWLGALVVHLFPPRGDNAQLALVLFWPFVYVAVGVHLGHQNRPAVPPGTKDRRIERSVRNYLALHNLSLLPLAGFEACMAAFAPQPPSLEAYITATLALYLPYLAVASCAFLYWLRAHKMIMLAQTDTE